MHEHKSSFKCGLSCSRRLLVKVVAEVGRVEPVVALNTGVESKRGKSLSTKKLAFRSGLHYCFSSKVFVITMT